MKNFQSKIKNAALALLLSAICLLPFGSRAITPFFIKGFNSVGTALASNQVGITTYPPSDKPWTVYGTNLIYGGNILTITLDGTGYSSNALFAGNYLFYFTNLNAAFIASIPDTTNFQSLSLYITNAPVYPGFALNSYGLTTNLLGFAPATNNTSGIVFALGYTPANVASLGTIASRASNDFALATSLGTIAGRASNDFALASSIGTIAGRSSNDFALATSLGTIAGRASNDFALATSLGTIAGRSSNDFHLADGYIGQSSLAGIANIVTNGFQVWVVYKTNGLPGIAFTNLPAGSLMSTTNGGFYVLSNLVWTAH